MTLQTVRNSNSLRGYWKFNNSLLEDSIFIKNIEALATDIFNSEMTDFVSKWEIFKFKFRHLAIKRSKEIKKDRDHMETELLDNIDNLWKIQTLSPIQDSELHSLQAKLNDLYTNKVNGAFVRSRAKWIENGERNTAYFFALEKRNFKR